MPQRGNFTVARGKPRLAAPPRVSPRTRTAGEPRTTISSGAVRARHEPHLACRPPEAGHGCFLEGVSETAGSARRLRLDRHVLGHLYPGWRRETRLTPGYVRIAALRLRTTVRVSRISVCRCVETSSCESCGLWLSSGTEAENANRVFFPNVLPCHGRPDRSRGNDSPAICSMRLQIGITVNQHHCGVTKSTNTTSVFSPPRAPVPTRSAHQVDRPRLRG